MPEKQYVILLDEVARKRHYHVVTAGKITKFVVQLEVKVRGFGKKLSVLIAPMVIHIKTLTIKRGKQER